MASTKRGKNAGIDIRHVRSCAARRQGRCGCSPRYRAEAYDSRQGRRVYKNFRTLAEAKARRADAQAALRKGTLTAARSATLDEAAATWLAGAADGSVRNRSGDIYKPSVVRGYEQALRLRALPELVAAQLSKIRRAELQALVDRLLVEGHSPSTIRNTLLPVRSIFRRAVARGEVAVSPTTGLELPAVRGRRDRIASPDEARQLLDTLERDRALSATAMYSGLRMGELRALEWDAIDFEAGIIDVRRLGPRGRGRCRRSPGLIAAASRSRRCCGPTSLACRIGSATSCGSRSTRSSSSRSSALPRRGIPRSPQA